MNNRQNLWHGTTGVIKIIITLHVFHKRFHPFFLHLQFLEEAGFCKVRAEDRTVQFIEVIEAELKRAEAIKEEFIEVSLATTEINGIVARWEFITKGPNCDSCLMYNDWQNCKFVYLYS